jgi:hypothetical protein
MVDDKDSFAPRIRASYSCTGAVKQYSGIPEFFLMSQSGRALTLFTHIYLHVLRRTVLFSSVIRYYGLAFN